MLKFLYMFKMVHGLLIGVQLHNILCIYSKEQSGTCRTDEPKLPVDAKRKVDLKWDDYFMAMACLASTRRGSWKGKPTVRYLDQLYVFPPIFCK